MTSMVWINPSESKHSVLLVFPAALVDPAVPASVFVLVFYTTPAESIFSSLHLTKLVWSFFSASGRAASVEPVYVSIDEPPEVPLSL